VPVIRYLIDASFIQVDRAFARDLSRARYNRSSRVRIVSVPDHLNSNASSVHLLNAALAAGLYPKILSVDSTTGQMRTIANNQAAFFHPTSVNRGRKPQDLGAHHLSFFTMMSVLEITYLRPLINIHHRRQSKKMYAWETGPADDVALLLLCGEGEFKVSRKTAALRAHLKLK
jgi:ATP-dependent RNA helicase DHX29